MHIPQLLRSGRLGRDVNVLRRGFPTSHPITHLNKQWQSWHAQIAIAITDRPHVVLAYAWVMYMALFNGGRWIRAQLEAAGWQLHQDEGRDYLSFWQFDGHRDGEDIKDEFKKRFDEVAALLTPAERDDVVQESRRIFDICAEMVAWLDEQTAPRGISTRDGIGGDAKESVIPVVRTLTALLSTPWRLLGSMLRSLGRCFRTSAPQVPYEKMEHVE